MRSGSEKDNSHTRSLQEQVCLLVAVYLIKPDLEWNIVLKGSFAASILYMYGIQYQQDKELDMFIWIFLYPVLYICLILYQYLYSHLSSFDMVCHWGIHFFTNPDFGHGGIYLFLPLSASYVTVRLSSSVHHCPWNLELLFLINGYLLFLIQFFYYIHPSTGCSWRWYVLVQGIGSNLFLGTSLTVSLSPGSVLPHKV